MKVIYYVHGLHCTYSTLLKAMTLSSIGYTINFEQSSLQIQKHLSIMEKCVAKGNNPLLQR